MGRLRNRRTAHPKCSDSRSLLSYLPKKRTSTPRAYFIVKAMIGKTQQGKKEVRALASGEAEQDQTGGTGGYIHVTSWLARGLKLDQNGEES